MAYNVMCTRINGEVSLKKQYVEKGVKYRSFCITLFGMPKNGQKLNKFQDSDHILV